MAAVDPQRWLALSPLLDELLDLAPAEREARLARLQAEDPETAGLLRELLARSDALKQDGFLSEPAVAPWRDALAPEADDAPPADLTGQSLGPYVLERPLGQGGMGTVWLARRADGRFEGRVAVKFLAAGVVGRGAASRFQREGQILARLSHPHIARLLDAGVHEQQPYLVLEYVDGQPIDAYCRQHRLDAEARVRLFLDVLAAVAHAHARLILHRDLKPSNILVTADGDVKLLDFGIAKLLDDAHQAMDGAAATELTQRAGSAFTPQFAAPEQVQQADVTTATDVYALGVLLYLLLGGLHPTAGDTQTRLDRLKAVVEHVPRRLSDVAADQPDEVIAGQARRLRGDLDTIVAKALKKSPAERYSNAQALADDLQRWLAHEPIAARPDSRLYVLGRFVRRHRLSVAAGAVAVLGLVGLTGVSVLQARRAHAAEQQAEQRRQQSDDLLTYMLGDFADKLRPIGRLELLDSVGGKSLDHLRNDATALRPQERLSRAKALTVIGEVRVTRRDLDGALEPLRAARSLLDGAPPEPALTAGWRKAQGAADFWLGRTLSLKRDPAAALKAWEDYRAVSQRWLDELPQDMEAVVELSYAYTNLGSAALEGGRVQDAQQAFSRSIELKRRALQALDPDRRDATTAELANSLSYLGTTLLWQGEFTRALETFRGALAEIAQVREKHPSEALWLYREGLLRQWAGDTLATQGQPALAERELQAAVDAISAAAAQDPSNKTWQSDLLLVQLLAQDARAAAGRPVAAAELASLRARLEQLEQSGNEALRIRRLPERARWARLHAGLPGTPVAEGDQVLQDTRQRLLAALRAQPDDERLSRALALLGRAWLVRTQARPEAHAQACAAVHADNQLMRAFLRRDHLVTTTWLASQSCPGHEADAEAASTRDWLASRQ